MYRVAYIPKSNGTMRAIAIPDKKTRANLVSCKSSIVGFVHGTYGRFHRPGSTPMDILQGDMASKGKGCKANARAHRNAYAILNCDIANFFGSVTPEMFFKLYPLKHDARETVLSNAFFRGVLPTGAMTSPMIASMVMHDADLRIRTYCRKLSEQYKVTITYTRYVDDMTVSIKEDTHGREESHEILWHAHLFIIRELSLLHMAINGSKTRVQFRGEHQSVTGLTTVHGGVGRAYIKRVKLLIKHLRVGDRVQKQRVRGMIAYIRQHNPLTADNLKAMMKERGH